MIENANHTLVTITDPSRFEMLGSAFFPIKNIVIPRKKAMSMDSRKLFPTLSW